jgi:hypothetical protein
MAANKAIFSHITAFTDFPMSKNNPTSQYFCCTMLGPEKENNGL